MRRLPRFISLLILFSSLHHSLAWDYSVACRYFAACHPEERGISGCNKKFLMIKNKFDAFHCPSRYSIAHSYFVACHPEERGISDRNKRL
jgi:hypothetical protein